MRRVGALGGDVQFKLMPAACVSVLLVACVILHSTAIDLCFRRKKKKSGKKYDGGGSGGGGYELTPQA